jgi:hypothetical protein
MSKYAYRVSRLGLDLGSFDTHDQAVEFVAKHCAMDRLRLLTDYATEYVKVSR